MIIIDKNLEHLAKQYTICEKILFDEFSLKIQLGHVFYAPKTDIETKIIYGSRPAPHTIFSEKQEIANFSI